MVTLDRMLEIVQGKGERITLQRRMVMEVMCQQHGHLTLGDIQTRLRTTLPEPTIYRILQWLKNLGIVSQTDMGESGVVYELISTPPHHHLICLNCGRVIEIDDGLFIELRDRLQAEFAFAPRIEHMAIYGQCIQCQSQDID